MAKAAKAPECAEITYTPLELSDPPFAVWNAHRFEANVPMRVSDPEMIERAKGNPWFKVAGEPQAERVASKALPVPPPGAGFGDDPQPDRFGGDDDA